MSFFQGGIFDEAPPINEITVAVTNLMKQEILARYVINEFGNYIRALQSIIEKQMNEQKRSSVDDIHAPKGSLDYLSAKAGVYRKHQQYIKNHNTKFAEIQKKYEAKITNSISAQGKTPQQLNGRAQSVLAHVNNARNEYEQFWTTFSATLWQ